MKQSAVKPVFKFFLDNINNPLSQGSEIWKACLPVTGNSAVKQIRPENNPGITYGDYFEAAAGFLKLRSFAALSNAIQRQPYVNASHEEISEIGIYLVKHGAFYHPSRVEVYIKNKKLQFVLNVTFSTIGRETLLKEYNILQKLNNSFSFLPLTYHYGELSLVKANQKAGLLLGEWLDEFNEFHLAACPDNKKKRILVWDSFNGNYYLSTEDSLDLYTRAATILTCYYNIETFEQIFPWHHAAGDFVVKKKGGGIELKLITVRQYASMLDRGGNTSRHEADAHSVLEGLLVFFLNLSIRMRLDRIDGVGDTVWADDVAVAGAFQGFLNGLALKAENNQSRKALNKCLIDLLASCSRPNLFDLMTNIVDAYDSRSPEIAIIKQNLDQHAIILHKVISKDIFG